MGKTSWAWRPSYTHHCQQGVPRIRSPFWQAAKRGWSATHAVTICCRCRTYSSIVLGPHSVKTLDKADYAQLFPGPHFGLCSRAIQYPHRMWNPSSRVSSAGVRFQVSLPKSSTPWTTALQTWGEAFLLLSTFPTQSQHLRVFTTWAWTACVSLSSWLSLWPRYLNTSTQSKTSPFMTNCHCSMSAASVRVRSWRRRATPSWQSCVPLWPCPIRDKLVCMPQSTHLGRPPLQGAKLSRVGANGGSGGAGSTCLLPHPCSQERGIEIYHPLTAGPCRHTQGVSQGIPCQWHQTRKCHGRSSGETSEKRPRNWACRCRTARNALLNPPLDITASNTP